MANLTVYLLESSDSDLKCVDRYLRYPGQLRSKPPCLAAVEERVAVQPRALALEVDKLVVFNRVLEARDVGLAAQEAEAGLRVRARHEQR